MVLGFISSTSTSQPKKTFENTNLGVSLLCHICSLLPSGLTTFIPQHRVQSHTGLHWCLTTHPSLLGTTCASHIMLWIVPDHTSLQVISPLWNILLILSYTQVRHHFFSDIFTSCPFPLKIKNLFHAPVAPRVQLCICTYSVF